MRFWTIVNKVIKDADVLLLLLDARFIAETRNAQVEERVEKAGKPLVYVVTKTDLVDKKPRVNTRKPLVYFNSKDREGTRKLRERILIEGARVGCKDIVRVGVLGYPNVGKSSLINAMKGKKSAPTSARSGYTTRMRLVKATAKIMFLDSPGVIPYKDTDKVAQVMTGSVDYERVRDPDLTVMELMKRFPGKIEAYFDVEVHEDLEETIEAIAKKRRMVLQKGVPDIERACRQILKLWQEGKI